MRLRKLLGAIAVIVACSGDPWGVAPPAAPLVEGVAVTVNPNNVLSAVVSGRVRFADSVAVRFGWGPELDSTTLAAPLMGESVVLPVFGLLSETTYRLRLAAYLDTVVALSDVLAFTTGPLPSDLPRYAASGVDPSPGYVTFAAGMYGLVIDNTGRVVWYHRFPGGPGLNFQALPNGRYAARPPTTANATWTEIDPLGAVTRTLGCTRGLVSRFHDLIAEPAGSYWIMCDETRAMDLSAVGGVTNAQVTGTVVQHVSAAGELLFEWTPFDHFEITDLELASRTGSSVNWTHGNALDLDGDGNLIVSFRSLSEITKIDTRTGAVVWRMGGPRNQFALEGASGPGFARQHGLRVAGEGRFGLLDNLGDPGGSRAERYTYDAELRTARLTGSYGPNPPVTALLGGTTQNLAGGRTLVAFGNGGRVQEYDASGAVVWEIEGSAGYVFRAQRIRTLYRPGVGSPR